MTENKLKHYQVIFEIKDFGIYEILAESEEHAMIIGDHKCRNFENFSKTDHFSRKFLDVKPLYKEFH